MRSRTQRALFVVPLCAAGFLAGRLAASAQEQATQAFTVRVPPKLSVTPPTPTASLTHDGTDGDQMFAAQQWDVRANAISGATVTFSTNQAFTHTDDADSKCDARIDLAVASPENPGGWTVAVGSDRTFCGSAVPDEQATVRAVSSRPGRATFDVMVTFLNNPDQPLQDGEYTLTVVGTLTAN